MRKTHASRRGIFVELLETKLGGELELIGSSAGLHCTALFRSERCDVQIAQALEQAGVIARPLSRYYATGTPASERRQGLVLGFACAKPHQIRHGVRILTEVLADKSR